MIQLGLVLKGTQIKDVLFNRIKCKSINYISNVLCINTYHHGPIPILYKKSQISNLLNKPWSFTPFYRINGVYKVKLYIKTRKQENKYNRSKNKNMYKDGNTE